MQYGHDQHEQQRLQQQQQQQQQQQAFNVRPPATQLPPLLSRQGTLRRGLTS